MITLLKLQRRFVATLAIMLLLPAAAVEWFTGDTDNIFSRWHDSLMASYLALTAKIFLDAVRKLRESENS